MSQHIFTRYLYYIGEVVNSLHWSILEKQCDESLYWVYELYFSGFQEEAFYFIKEFSNMYNDEIYPQYEAYINKEYQEWKKNQTDHCIIGTIVKMLVQSKVSITNALRIRQNIKIEEKIYEGNDMIVSRLLISEIHKYQTLKLGKNMRNWTFLNKVACKYVIRRVICDDLSNTYPNIEKINFDNWLYYASHTPIWGICMT
jgi:hypothetical protein